MPQDDDTTARQRALAEYLGARPRLWAIAYRTLGNATDADDVAQEAWLRWQRVDTGQVGNPAAFLAVTATRLALNVATAARARHEVAVEPTQLGDGREPGPDDTDPESRAGEGDEVEHAIGLLLATLSPAEFAAYVLRVSFDYPYSRVATLLDVQPAHARQLVSRARSGVRFRPPRPVERATIRRQVRAFLLAARAGRLDVLERELRARVQVDVTAEPIRRSQPEQLSGHGR